MFEIVGFYFGIIASLFVDLLQKFEIFPGIPYGTWLIGLMFFGSFLSVVFVAVKKENMRLAQLAVRRNREIDVRGIRTSKNNKVNTKVVLIRR